MKNNQSKPDTKPLWGLKKKPLSNKPKEERILEMITRIVARIQNDERGFRDSASGGVQYRCLNTPQSPPYFLPTVPLLKSQNEPSAPP